MGHAPVINTFTTWTKLPSVWELSQTTLFFQKKKRKQEAQRTQKVCVNISRFMLKHNTLINRVTAWTMKFKQDYLKLFGPSRRKRSWKLHRDRRLEWNWIFSCRKRKQGGTEVFLHKGRGSTVVYTHPCLFCRRESGCQESSILSPGLEEHQRPPFHLHSKTYDLGSSWGNISYFLYMMNY